MKILILGAGQVGPHRRLPPVARAGQRSHVVDTNEDVLRDLQDRLDIRTVAGNASYPSVLEAAGIADTDILVALTSSDEVNIVACEIAHALYRTPTKIARIRAARIHHARAAVRRGRAGGGRLDQPRTAGDRVHRAAAVTIPAHCRWWTSPTARCSWSACARARRPAGRPQLRTLREHLPDTEARVAAIYRNGRLRAARGDTVIEENDEIFFVAARDDLRRVMARSCAAARTRCGGS
jgi:trk system potassium uptake protein TrkA